ncbi:MAG: OmpA family protein [Myxococcales bacterium]|nr:OmpA family protein [Myxococcales bacterium]
MNTPVTTATLGLIVLCVFALWFRAPAIEADLQRAVDHQLESMGAAATAQVDGREVVLTGTATSAAEAAHWVDAVESVWGVRTVTSKLDRSEPVRPVAGTSQAPSPAAAAAALSEELQRIMSRSEVTFQTDSHWLSHQGRAALVDVASALAETPDLQVQIGGHTDSRGPPAFNRFLSQRRADAVVAQLQELGVDPSRLHPVGFGATLPRDTNRTARGRAHNRRIEFQVIVP